MNNLKFRAWDKANKEMLKIDVIDFFSEEIIVLEEDFSIKFSDVEIMQSTGYKDKKGIEIFIGDIVKIYIEDREEHKVYYALCKVIFDEEILTTRLEIIERFCDMLMPAKYLCLKNVEDIVIAGNIYENKELLRK
ncbi:YopX family protein [Parvimonas sp. G1641]|uniref:YopX family protein n=1 Tax=Parvimonas sp. G1641 TaxID=3388846 RepID=UPI00397FD05B